MARAVKAKKFVGVKIENFDAVMAKLNLANPIYAGPWKAALRKAVDMVEANAEDRAPFRRGATISSISSRLDSREIPQWGIVTANASNNGFRYPCAFNAGKDKKFKVGAKAGQNAIPHYRTGPKRRRSTKNWFTGAVSGMKKKMAPILNIAIKDIETRWNL